MIRKLLILCIALTNLALSQGFIESRADHILKIFGVMGITIDLPDNKKPQCDRYRNADIETGEKEP